MKIFGSVKILCSIWPSQSYFSQRELNLAASTMLYIAPLEGGGARHGGGRHGSALAHRQYVASPSRSQLPSGQLTVQLYPWKNSKSLCVNKYRKTTWHIRQFENQITWLKQYQPNWVNCNLDFHLPFYEHLVIFSLTIISILTLL